MIELVIVFCMAKTPRECYEKRLPPVDGVGSYSACMTAAQQTAAQFIAVNPEFIFKGARCEPDNARKENA